MGSNKSNNSNNSNNMRATHGLWALGSNKSNNSTCVRQNAWSKARAERHGHGLCQEGQGPSGQAMQTGSFFIFQSFILKMLFGAVVPKPRFGLKRDSTQRISTWSRGPCSRP